MTNAVRYIVADVDRAVAFYVGQLGFTLDEQMCPAFARVRRDDLVLWLSGPASSAARPMPDGRRPVAGVATGGPATTGQRRGQDRE